MSSRIALIGTAALIAVAPVFVTATAANADDSFAVTSPTQGQMNVPELLPAVVQFTGTGLSADDHIDVRYVTGDGSVRSAVNSDFGPEDNGDWNALANFGQLGVGQTQVVATVLELNEANEVLQTRPLTFTLAVAPNPANPFTVTYPGAGTVVDTPTPTFTGTGVPGADIVIIYGARSVTEAEAGTGVVDVNGNFSIETDFSRLEPGSLGTGADVYQYLNGEEIPGAGRLAIGFTFAAPPVPLIPLTLTIDPSLLTVDTVKNADQGVQLAATGFSPNERLSITLTGPDGVAVDVAGADGVFADVEDGSYVDRLTLTGDVLTGQYTVTITGDRSLLTVSASFTVVANAVTPGTPTAPGTPGAPVRSAGAPGSGTLANTGFDGSGLGLLAGGLLLGGIVLAAARRRANA
jgi:hypothetical protein